MPDEVPLPEELQPCPSCAALLDVSEQEPLAKVHCPMCGAAVVVQRTYDHFLVKEFIASGGMGSVYRAMDTNLNRMVALKLLKKEFGQDPDEAAKLEVEAKITASITHPYVVRVYSFGCDHGQFYLAMELVDKGSLDDLMQIQNRVSETQMLQVGLQIAQGLNAAHKRGLIHRDVKPGNILFADAHTAKIVDFGLALLAEKEAEARGEIWGTPYYIAPEKLNHEAEDFRSDIYSLGGTMFHALAGRPPFEAQTASLVALKHLKSQAVSLQAFAPDVSSETAFVINRMLNKNPDERYASYEELIEHLEYAHASVLEKSASGTNRKKVRVVVESELSKKLMGWMTLATLAVLIIGVGAYFFYQSQHQPPPVVPQGQVTLASASVPETYPPGFSERYQEGRNLLIAQRPADARKIFEELAAMPDAPQPSVNWALFHAGICALLENQEGIARKSFERLKESAVYSTARNDLKLAEFFKNTGEILSSDVIASDTDIPSYSGVHGESIGLLALGLHNWMAGDLPVAVQFLQAYTGIEAESPMNWVDDYKASAAGYLRNYSVWKTAVDNAANASDPEAQKQSMTEVRALRAQLNARNPLQQDLFQAEKNLSAKIRQHESAAFEQDQKVKREEQGRLVHENDLARWETLKGQVPPLLPQYQFDRAKALLVAATFLDPEVKQLQKAEIQKMDWLRSFKDQFFSDIRSIGFPNPVIDRGRATYREGVKQVDGETLKSVTQYGSIPIPLINLDPGMIMRMAAYFIEKSNGTSDKAQRSWLAAVFAHEMGMTREAIDLGVSAAKDDAAYKAPYEVVFGASTGG